MVQESEAKGRTAYLNMNLISKNRALKISGEFCSENTKISLTLSVKLLERVKTIQSDFFSLFLYLMKRSGGSEESSNSKDTDSA